LSSSSRVYFPAVPFLGLPVNLLTVELEARAEGSASICFYSITASAWAFSTDIFGLWGKSGHVCTSRMWLSASEKTTSAAKVVNDVDIVLICYTCSIW